MKTFFRGLALVCLLGIGTLSAAPAATDEETKNRDLNLFAASLLDSKAKGDWEGFLASIYHCSDDKVIRGIYASFETGWKNPAYRLVGMNVERFDSENAPDLLQGTLDGKKPEFCSNVEYIISFSFEEDRGGGASRGLGYDFPVGLVEGKWKIIGAKFAGE